MYIVSQLEKNLLNFKTLLLINKIEIFAIIKIVINVITNCSRR